MHFFAKGMSSDDTRDFPAGAVGGAVFRRGPAAGFQEPAVPRFLPGMRHQDSHGRQPLFLQRLLGRHRDRSRAQVPALRAAPLGARRIRFRRELYLLGVLGPEIVGGNHPRRRAPRRRASRRHSSAQIRAEAADCATACEALVRACRCGNRHGIIRRNRRCPPASEQAKGERVQPVRTHRRVPVRSTDRRESPPSPQARERHAQFHSARRAGEVEADTERLQARAGRGREEKEDTAR